MVSINKNDYGDYDVISESGELLGEIIKCFQWDFCASKVCYSLEELEAIVAKLKELNGESK